MEFTFIVIIGLCIGSFLNVCIYRIPIEESIAYPGSHCTTCQYELKWYDLLPVISFFLLKGKCRECGDKISMKYLMVEVAHGVIYLLLFITYGWSFTFIKYCLFTSLLFVIGLIDLATKYVYTSTIVVGSILGVLFIGLEILQTHQIPFNLVLGAILGSLIIGLIVWFTGGMGTGDIEIALLCGLFLGVKGVLLTLFLGFISGGAAGVYLLITGVKGKRDELAFGPYLAFGAIVFMLWGDLLMHLYIIYCF